MKIFANTLVEIYYRMDAQPQLSNNDKVISLRGIITGSNKTGVIIDNDYQFIPWTSIALIERVRK